VSRRTTTTCEGGIRRASAASHPFGVAETPWPRHLPDLDRMDEMSGSDPACMKI
jgi:hypothetical protein